MSIEKLSVRTIIHSFAVTLFIFALSIASCNSRRARPERKGAHTEQTSKDAKFSENDVAGALEGIFGPGEPDDSSGTKKKTFSVARVMQKTYRDEDYYPIWLTENGDTSSIGKLLEELEALKYDGIDAARYHVAELRNMIDHYATAQSVSNDEVIKLDTLCTLTYLQASRDLLLGLVVPKKADSLWYHVNDSVWTPYIGLAKFGKNESDYPSLDSFRSKWPTYKMLRNVLVKYDQLSTDLPYQSAKAAAANGHVPDSVLDAIIQAELPWTVEGNDSFSTHHEALVAAYKYYIHPISSKVDSTLRSSYKTPVDTIVSKIALNMERLRWIQQQPEPMYVIVDVPLLELFFRKDGNNAMHMEVVVGRTIRQTPALYAHMANVVINPPWGVPPTIMKKDVLPGMAKSGVAYLQKKGLKVYDHKGNAVNASSVNESNYKRYLFRQDPGDDNALGYVKFNLPNPWDIYMHDTPHREDFGKRDRFKSSGCIRVQQPRELAEFILADIEGKRFDQVILDSMIETHKTRWEVLSRKIPVHVVYLTAFEDETNTRVHFMPDVYKRDAKLAALLK